MQMKVTDLFSVYDSITGFIHIEYKRTDKSSLAVFGEKNPHKSALVASYIYLSDITRE